MEGEVTYLHFIGALMAAWVIIAAVLLTAPNITVGTNRLRVMFKALTVTIVIAGLVIGVIMLVWGVTTRSEGLMYFSMVPIAIAFMVMGRRNRI